MASGAVGELRELRGPGVAQLVAMGFEEPAAAQAMSDARGDINRALSTLVGEEHPPSRPPAPSFGRYMLAQSRDSNPFEAFYRSVRRERATGSAGARRLPTSEATQPESTGSSFPMLSVRAPPLPDVRSRPATRQARPSRRPRANSEEHEAARQRILAEAAAEAAAGDAGESARGAPQGTRGSRRRRRRRQEQHPDSDRPTRRQRTSTALAGDEDFDLDLDGSEFRYRPMFHEMVFRPPSPASVERDSGRAAAAEPPMAPRPEREERDDLRFPPFPAGPFRPFRVFRPSHPDEEAPLGMSSGLPFAFVFEIAQEVMRAASNQRPARRGAKQEVIDALPTINGCPDDACLICQQDFKVEERPTSITCGHAFHLDCLKPWLSDHNTCPTCRYELETDDEEYNRRLAAKRQEQAQQDQKRGREAHEGSPRSVPPPLRSRASERSVPAAAPAPAAAAATNGSRSGDGSESSNVASTLRRRALAAVAVANLQRRTAELRREHEQLREQLRASQPRQRRREHQASRRHTARDSNGPPPLPELESRSRDQQPSRSSLPVSPIVEAPTADAS